MPVNILDLLVPIIIWNVDFWLRILYFRVRNLVVIHTSRFVDFMFCNLDFIVICFCTLVFWKNVAAACVSEFIFIASRHFALVWLFFHFIYLFQIKWNFLPWYFIFSLFYLGSIFDDNILIFLIQASNITHAFGVRNALRIGDLFLSDGLLGNTSGCLNCFSATFQNCFRLLCVILEHNNNRVIITVIHWRLSKSWLALILLWLGNRGRNLYFFIFLFFQNESKNISIQLVKFII